MPKVAKELLPSPKRIFCNSCQHNTNHVCVGEHYVDIPNKIDEAIFLERLGYRLWICAGCDDGTMEGYVSPPFPEELNATEVEESWDYWYHPDRRVSIHPTLEFKVLPPNLVALYGEVVRAYNAEINVLTAIGIRALIEGICADKRLPGGNLADKIEHMTTILPANIVCNLHELRFMGNTAAHELEAPPKEELTLALQVCEDLLNFIYELDYKARALNEIRSQRRGQVRPGTARRIIPFGKPDSKQPN